MIKKNKIDKIYKICIAIVFLILIIPSYFYFLNNNVGSKYYELSTDILIFAIVFCFISIPSITKIEDEITKHKFLQIPYHKKLIINSLINIGVSLLFLVFVLLTSIDFFFMFYLVGILATYGVFFMLLYSKKLNQK